MKELTILSMLVLFLSCNTVSSENKNDKIADNVTEEKEYKYADRVDNIKTDLIIGERIDGPANIRDKPNGEILFELYDNALVEVSSKEENGWYQVFVGADIDYNEFGMDSIKKNRLIIVDDIMIGKVLKTHSVSTGQGADFSFASLYGYTHKSNIKPETVLETAFIKELAKYEHEFSSWKDFIKMFDLKLDAIGHPRYDTYYKYENCVDDPSPGFRVVLLFEKEQLVGFIHSRDFEIDNSQKHKLEWNYYVTFYDYHPENEQLEFIDYMNVWIQGVD